MLEKQIFKGPLVVWLFMIAEDSISLRTCSSALAAMASRQLKAGNSLVSFSVKDEFVRAMHTPHCLEVAAK